MLTETKKTTDYSIFKKFPGNRPIDNNNLKKITNSISMHNMLEFKPLVVNENMQIIDGQHRLEAAKNLGLEVYYTMQKDTSPVDIILLQTGKDWLIDDYIRFYASQGKEGYSSLLKLAETTKTTLPMVLYTLGYNTGNNFKCIKNGELETLTQQDISEVKDKLSKIDQVLAFIDEKVLGPKLWLKGSFMKRALLMLLNNASFEFDVFLNKLHFNLGKIRPCHSGHEYYEMFKGIYNMRNQNPIE